MTGKYKQAAKKTIKSMSELLDDTQTRKPTITQLHKSTKPEIHKGTNSQKARLDAEIPQDLKWRLEDYVRDINRTRKRGNKTSMTAELVTAIENHLLNK
jgi:hypothetical protein